MRTRLGLAGPSKPAPFPFLYHRRKLMRGMIRVVALGVVLAAGAATGAMAQGINNTGYSRDYYNNNNYYGNEGYSGSGTWYDRQGYGSYPYAPAPNYGPPGDRYGSSSPY